MIQLYIKNQEIDIDKSVGLYLTKEFESLNNPTLYHSDYSKTITIPMTAKNRRIFENFQRQDSLVTNQSIDPRVKIPYKLLYNSEMVMEGYFKINNGNTCFGDNRFEIELYGEFNAIMNDIAQYTFNKYETVSNGGSKPDEYLIESPWSNIEVTASLVKQSFEQESHNPYGNDILDYIKFIPTYQGKYKDFENDMQQVHPFGMDVKLSQERDEHYMREFRSYYQQPAVWVDKLWLLMKEKVETTTDYTIDLDPSWFNEHNPYWTDLIYTCPSLFTEDENFNPNTTDFMADSLNMSWNITSQGSLSNIHKRTLLFTPSTQNNELYLNGVFNPNMTGTTLFKMSSSLMLCCHHYNPGKNFAKLKKNNPIIVGVEAVAQNGGAVLAYKKYLIYSNSLTSTNYSVDANINVGSTSYTNPNVTSGGIPTGYSQSDGYWFEAPLDIQLEINQNVPYLIKLSFRWSNNGKPCQTATYTNSIIWTDWFWTTSAPKGVTIFNNLKSASVTTTNYLRSRSEIDMYRVFPKKDTTLLSVLLNYSKMFGLLWDVDIDNKKISVMTRNRFFTGSRIMDWTDKIDRHHDFKLDPLCFEKRYVAFNTEEGKGQRYETYNEKYGVGYGSKKIDTEFQFNTDTDEFFKGIQPSMIAQKAQFSILYNTEDPDEANFMGYNYKVYPDERYVENDDEGENAGNSGAFYFFNGTFTPDSNLGYNTAYGTCVFVTDDTPYMQRMGKFMWNLSLENTEICNKLPSISTIDRSGRYSVHFEKPAEYYFDADVSQTDYVYNLFWKNFINDRYSVQNKKLTCYVYLTPAEFKAIRFKDFVKIQNTIYHINKVFDYDFDTNSPTKVELCQIWDITSYTKGQHGWPALVPVPDIIDVVKTDYTDVYVYSEGEWYVHSKPSWITYIKNDDNLQLKANSEPLYPRNGTIVLKSTDSPVLTATIEVRQRPSNVFLNVDVTSRTVESDGFCFCVNISSQPTSVTVTSPSWCDVKIVPRHQADFLDTKCTDFTAFVTVRTNYSIISRTGNIVFSNGNIQKTVVVSQLGRSFIWEQIDDIPMNVEINHTGIFETYSNTEVDPETTEISTLGSVVKPNKKIEHLYVEFAPALDTSDYGDGSIETSSGGQVMIKTLDGKWITKNFNYGNVTPQHEIWIEQKEGGHFTVNGTDWYIDYKETTDEGTEYSVVAIPDSGSVFVEWSDGVQTASRTITVDSDIHIWAIFEDNNSYLYDNEETVRFDNEESVDY